MVEIRALEMSVVGSWPCAEGEAPDHVEKRQSTGPDGVLRTHEVGYRKYVVTPAHFREAMKSEMDHADLVVDAEGKGRILVLPEQRAVVPRAVAENLVARGLVEIVAEVAPASAPSAKRGRS